MSCASPGKDLASFAIVFSSSRSPVGGDWENTTGDLQSRRALSERGCGNWEVEQQISPATSR
jgi:hypothetical protein